MAFDAPGVYVRYKTDGPLVVRAASTSTAVFIGPTIIGNTLSGTGAGLVVSPVLVSSPKDYAEHFTTTGAASGIVCLAGASADFTDSMGHAVRGFYMNGGQNAYIVSTSTGTAARAAGNLKLKTTDGILHFAVAAASDGAWGNDVALTARQSAIGKDYLDLEVTLTLKGDGEAIVSREQFIGQRADQLDKTGSAIVAITALAAAPSGTPLIDLDISGDPPAPVGPKKLAGGKNSNATVSTEIEGIFGALRDVDDISLIVLPDRVWPTHQADYSSALAHCQAMKDRMTLIQLADDQTDFGNVSVPMDKYAAVYYPQARVTLPTPGAGQRMGAAVNTTGHVAGVFARTDAEKGPWTAPAGMHAALAGITELTRDISQTYQERMNPNNINALRYIQGVPVIWGARTRDQGGIYEYIPVMRTAFLIADSLREALNRVVFAKNTEVLWGNVKAGVSGFMDGLFAQGAFQGASPGQAYRVTIGLGQSMSQDDIRKGLMRLNVAFAPAFPAEVIEIVIEQIFEPG